MSINTIVTLLDFLIERLKRAAARRREHAENLIEMANTYLDEAERANAEASRAEKLAINLDRLTA
jgi:hypothetical protein